MKTYFVKYFLGILFIGWGSIALGQTIDEIVICETVTDLDPVNEKSTFNKGEKAYCWLRISDATVGDSITIAWYHEEELKHLSRLAMKYESMRTYANKTLYETGNWRIVIQSDAGAALTSKEIVVTEE